MNEEEKQKKIVHCLDLWLIFKEKNYSLGAHLKKKNIHSVGVYGYGVLGRHLLKELLDAEIEVKWLMDKRNVSGKIACVYLEPECTQIPCDVDVIINTALGSVEEVEKKFIDYGFSRVISIDELLEEIKNSNQS